MTQTEKLVKIILPDLLHYLEMVESGEIIQKRLDKRKNRGGVSDQFDRGF